MSSSNISSFAATPVGKTIDKTLRPLLHLARRIKSPTLPVLHEHLTASWGNHTKRFEVRRRNPCDSGAIRQCFSEEQYEIAPGPHFHLVQAAYDAIVAANKRPLIVDCGANIGASVTWFLLRYPQARILAVEPETRNFSLLKKNTKGLNVELIQAGISESDGRGVFKDPATTGMSVAVEESNEGEVQLVSVDTLLEDYATDQDVPFLLKFDIEGSERNMFTAAKSAIDTFPVIILEPHDWMFPGERTARNFLRWHLDADRELAVKFENLISLSRSLFPS